MSPKAELVRMESYSLIVTQKRSLFGNDIIVIKFSLKG